MDFHLVVDLVQINLVCKVAYVQMFTVFLNIYIEEKKEEAPKPAGGFSFGGFGANKPGKINFPVN